MGMSSWRSTKLWKNGRISKPPSLEGFMKTYVQIEVNKVM